MVKLINLTKEKVRIFTEKRQRERERRERQKHRGREREKERIWGLMKGGLGIMAYPSF